MPVDRTYLFHIVLCYQFPFAVFTVFQNFPKTFLELISKLDIVTNLTESRCFETLFICNLEDTKNKTKVFMSNYCFSRVVQIVIIVSVGI